MASRFGGSLVSEIVYDPYLMLICSYDAEWTQHRPRPGGPWFEAFTRIMNEHVRRCRTYGGNVNRNYEQFCKANQAKPKKPLASPYFDPVFYLPLGHSDVMSLTLLDDFDPLHYLTGGVTTAIEDIALGFCPKPRSIGARQGEKLFPSIPSLWKTLKARDESQTPSLLLFCKLKMDGLASLGLAHPCQASIWKTIVARIRSITEAMRHDLTAETHDSRVGRIRREDLKSIRCVCLDLQGCEEIGLLIFSSDLCAATCILSGLLGLTYEDLFAESPELAPLLGRSKIHRRIAAFNHSDGRDEIPGDELRSVIRDHHVLRWTYSSVAVIPGSALGNPRRLYCDGRKCRGQVRADTKVRIPPGHQKRANRISDATREVAVNPRAQTGESETAYSELLIGLYDASFEHHVSSLAQRGDPLLSIGAVVDNLERTLEELSGGKDRRVSHMCRDAVDLETEISVPVPLLKDAEGRCLTYTATDTPHTSPLEELLPLVRDRLFYRGSTEAKALRKTGKANGYCRPNGLDLKRLMDAQRDLGIPVSLRREIECLFQNYAIYLADPFSFDVVLDLYDGFATLHAILVEHLRRVPLGRFESTEPEGRRLLDEARVRCIAEFVDALHDALVHRTLRMFPNAQNLDMAVDIRGGVNQILHATDTTLKCGLGVLRRFSSPAQKARGRDTVGCVIRLGKTPGARCCIAKLGVERWGRLAFFDMDTPHILHVASQADYLHEAFHLVFRDISEQDRQLADIVPRMEQHTLDRVEEVFSLMLWKLFVFGPDTDSFLFHSVLSYSRSMASVGTDDEDTCRRFTEMFTRLFLAVYGLQGDPGQDPRFWRPKYKKGMWQDDETARRHFENTLKRAARFFSEYKRLWEGDPKRRASNASMGHFGCVFKDIGMYLPLLHRTALRIYRQAMRSLLPGNKPEVVHQIVASIDAEVKEGLECGRPLVWSQYHRPAEVCPPKPMFESSANLDGDSLDALPLTCRMFYQYICTIRNAESMEIHLLRSNNQAKLDYEGRTDWYAFQADKGAAALFCPVPSARQKRLRKQIAILKSLWDIASEFRARRLLDILLSNAIVPPKQKG
jgi:hypothetical protein